MKILSLILLLLVSSNVFAFSLFGPKNYDECILENMKDINSDVAASAVKRACHMKFKEKEVDNSPKHNWILFNSYDEKTIYYDNSTITRKGKVVTLDVVTDYNKLQSINEGELSKDSDEYYSLTEKIEIDCINITYRGLNADFKSGHMGDGIARYHLGLDKEKKLKKDEALYKHFCSQ